ncbi:hypothetical protein K502DRAFT_365125 [Neoconidiobolus thromboides FSU 785]|nr:hypothetical protein K502DRAFT_365125 [Neoconidiobolus thromboides FSU 785]
MDNSVDSDGIRGEQGRGRNNEVGKQEWNNKAKSRSHSPVRREYNTSNVGNVQDDNSATRRQRSPSPNDESSSKNKYPKENYYSRGRYSGHEERGDRYKDNSHGRSRRYNENNYDRSERNLPRDRRLPAPDQFVSNYDFDHPTNNKVNEPGIPLPEEFDNEIPELVDPLNIPDLVSIDYYADYLRFNEPNQRHSDYNIKKRYEEYKDQYSVLQYKYFFEEHKNEPWFQEKYHPDYLKEYKQKLKLERMKAYEKFTTDLKEGVYDDICFDVPKAALPDISLELSVKKEVKEEEEGPKLEKKEDGEEETKKEEVVGEIREENNDDKIDIEDLPALFIKSIPPSISKAQILEVCKKADGFRYLMLGEPNMLKRFHRIGWVFFEMGTDLDKALEAVDKTNVDEFTLYFGKHLQKSSLRTANEISNTARRISIDSLQVQKLVKYYETMFDNEMPCNKLIQERLETIFRKKRVENFALPNDDLYETKQTLDLYLACLRNIFCFCYYCCVDSENPMELQRKCKNHLRSLPRVVSTRSGDIWVEQLDTKIERKLINEDDYSEIEKIGGINVKKITEEIIDSKGYVEELTESKHKCKICNKLFKGREYVKKHILSKHMDALNTEVSLMNYSYYNNYIRDPNRIVPLSLSQPINLSNNQFIGNNNTKNNNNSHHQGVYPLIQNNTLLNNKNNATLNYPGVYPISASTTTNIPIPNMVITSNNTNLNNNNTAKDPRQITSYVDLDAPDDFAF